MLWQNCKSYLPVQEMDRVGNTVKNGFDIWQIQIHFFEKMGARSKHAFTIFAAQTEKKIITTFVKK